MTAPTRTWEGLTISRGVVCCDHGVGKHSLLASLGSASYPSSLPARCARGNLQIPQEAETASGASSNQGRPTCWVPVVLAVGTHPRDLQAERGVALAVNRRNE